MTTAIKILIALAIISFLAFIFFLIKYINSNYYDSWTYAAATLSSLVMCKGFVSAVAILARK